jgi:hypothetical protein
MLRVIPGFYIVKALQSKSPSEPRRNSLKRLIYVLGYNLMQWGMR